MTIKEKLFFAIIVCLSIFTTIFSYAYVDLNLTISQKPLVLKVISSLQYLAYYKRPVATILFLILQIIFFMGFVLIISAVARGKISIKFIKISILATTLILTLGYPFLSSDIFNYMFDAKIISHYQQNPYVTKALDFPEDEWLRFMRWTHRNSPYGPLWLGLSLIPSLIGFGKFITTFFAFKLFISFFHLLNSFLIYKILKKVNPQNAILGLAFYGLNPLFLIEGALNNHNDILIATSFLLQIYFFTQRKKFLSYLSLLAGSAIKYISILVIPWPAIIKKYTNLIILNLATMTIFTIIFSNFQIYVPFVSKGSTQIQFQPWYLFWTLPLVALLPKKVLLIPAIALSIGAQVRYLPYLYWGDWSHPGTILFMQIVLLLLPTVAILTVAAKKLIRI